MSESSDNAKSSQNKKSNKIAESNRDLDSGQKTTPNCNMDSSQSAALNYNADSSQNEKSRQNPESAASVVRNAQKGKGGLRRVYNASIYSRDGLCAAWRDEQGFRQVVLVCVVSLVLGLYFGEGFTQKALLIMPGMLCVIVELFNSAIENAIDHTSLEPHPFAKKAKDMGSAAQFLSLVLVAVVWGLFVLERVF